MAGHQLPSTSFSVVLVALALSERATPEVLADHVTVSTSTSPQIKLSEPPVFTSATLKVPSASTPPLLTVADWHFVVVTPTCGALLTHLHDPAERGMVSAASGRSAGRSRATRLEVRKVLRARLVSQLCAEDGLSVAVPHGESCGVVA